MLHQLSNCVENVNPPVLDWQIRADRCGLYSSLGDQSENPGLRMSHIELIKEIMPNSTLNLKYPVPQEVGETSALILKESPEDLGRDDGIGHAVLVTINKQAPGDFYVELFDSTNKHISPVVTQQLKSLLPDNSRVCVHHVPVQDQGQTFYCCFFVIVFLTHLCLGLRQELDTIVFDLSRMHTHLELCCITEYVTEFPTVKDKNNLKLRDLKRDSIHDYYPLMTKFEEGI